MPEKLQITFDPKWQRIVEYDKKINTQRLNKVRFKRKPHLV